MDGVAHAKVWCGFFIFGVDNLSRDWTLFVAFVTLFFVWEGNLERSAKFDHFKVSPQDVETPASLLGFVSHSEKLKAWARERQDLGKVKETGLFRRRAATS